MRTALGAVPAALAIAGPAASCGAGTKGKADPDGAATGSMTLSSTAFADGGAIPSRHTCDGADVSPPLAWSGVPAGARSLVLFVHDPDAPDPAAPRVDWVHWVVYDLPPDATGLAEGATALPAGARAGTNDFGRTAWGGPCPPVGRHRYVFELHALDVVLPDLGTGTRAVVQAAMSGHVVATARRTGTYAKGGR